LEHICILCKDSSITVDDLPADFANLSRPETSFGAADAADTPQTILSALEEAKWNKTLAAHLLGISRRTLYRKIKEFNLIENIKTR
jgi:transcriptional regulator of acetoin/glycerol metabolism